MAYTPNTLSLVVNTVEGARKWWNYDTADSLATVKGANYFTDGLSRGMAVDDLLFANLLGGVAGLYKVTAVTASGATVTTATVTFT